VTLQSIIGVIAVGVCVATVVLLLLPRVMTTPAWRATVTPLASIIGSSFLILGPLLARRYGHFAIVAMALLCLAAWALVFA
jgi:hypothetical protein